MRTLLALLLTLFPLHASNADPLALCASLEAQLTDAALDSADTVTTAEYCIANADEEPCALALALRCDL
jgi:hypothetical protein